MIQRLATLLITLYISISLQAQDKKKPGFTKEEFRARQEAYLTQKAEITQEEATKFFPIYFELQDRKKTVNDKAWEQARKGKNPKTTDAEYEQIIEGIVKARIDWIWNIYSALKKSYLPRKYISYNVQRLNSTVIS